MKSNLQVLALLLGSSNALGLDPLPAMIGTVPTWSIGGTIGCYQCIRAGYVWCSAQWNYQSATTTYDPTVEKGKCCFTADVGAYTAAGNTPDKTIANSANCPAKYTNANDGSAIVVNIITSWCSYDTKVPELAIANCRQAQSICGVTASVLIADVTTAATNISMNNMVFGEKCTWVLKATLGAPAFQVTSTAAELTAAGIGNDYVIHYVEYTDTTTLRDNSYYIKFDEDQATTQTNKIRASYYDVNQFQAIEIPNIYTYINPAASSSRRKRWFPGQFIDRDIAQYKARVDYYNGLITTYDVERAAYDLKVKEANKYVDPWVATFSPPVSVAIPLRPAAPTQTAAYTGYTFSSTITYTTITKTSQILMWAEDITSENMGGWGQITMGLLKPVGLNGRSFGMLGQAEKTTVPVFDPTAQGFLGQTPYTKMAATTALGGKPQYLMVSLWANKYAAAAQVASKPFTFSMSSSVWKDLPTQWTPVAQPDKATDPISGAAASEVSASWLGVSLLSAISLSYLQ